MDKKYLLKPHCFNAMIKTDNKEGMNMLKLLTVNSIIFMLRQQTADSRQPSLFMFKIKYS